MQGRRLRHLDLPEGEAGNREGGGAQILWLLLCALPTVVYFLSLKKLVVF